MKHLKVHLELLVSKYATIKNFIKVNEILKITKGVASAGVGGFLVGGPAGSVAGGISAGTAIDSLYTVGENKPNGCFINLKRLKEDEHKASSLFDLGFGMVCDGLTGYNSAQQFSKINQRSNSKLYLI